MPVLENLRHGAHVESADGKDVGRLHSVVVDPRDNEVTHIIVNAGPHFPEPGFGAPELINVPIDQMEDAGEEKVVLRSSREEFRKLPQWVERDFTLAPSSEAGAAQEKAERTDQVHRLWNTGVALAASFANLLTGIAVPAEKVRKASFEREILNDAPVWRVEPHTHIGDVERVLVDEETDEIKELVIRRGALFGEDVVLPMEYVTEIQDGVVHVQLTDEELRGLQAY
jgi:sporulation protein YlmC with PRC-barrel domain